MQVKDFGLYCRAPYSQRCNEPVVVLEGDFLEILNESIGQIHDKFRLVEDETENLGIFDRERFAIAENLRRERFVERLKEAFDVDIRQQGNGRGVVCSEQEQM